MDSDANETDAYLNKVLGTAPRLSSGGSDPAPQININDDERSEAELGEETGGARCARKTMLPITLLWGVIGAAFGICAIRLKELKDFSYLWPIVFYFTLALAGCALVSGLIGFPSCFLSGSCGRLGRLAHAFLAGLATVAAIIVLIFMVMMQGSSDKAKLMSDFEKWAADDTAAVCHFQMRLECQGWSTLCFHSNSSHHHHNHSELTLLHNGTHPNGTHPNVTKPTECPACTPAQLDTLRTYSTTCRAAFVKEVKKHFTLSAGAVGVVAVLFLITVILSRISTNVTTSVDRLREHLII